VAARRTALHCQPDIDSVEANRNYVNITAGADNFTIRWTMQQAEGTLDPGMFPRIHRSVIVNTHKIREMERRFHGKYTLTLANGQRFTSGRAYRRQIQAHLKERAISAGAEGGSLEERRNDAIAGGGSLAKGLGRTGRKTGPSGPSSRARLNASCIQTSPQGPRERAARFSVSRRATDFLVGRGSRTGYCAFAGGEVFYC
jgi:hypothetical protein